MNPNTISKIFRIPEKLKISLLCVILETQYGGTLIYFSESHSFKYVSMDLIMCYDYQSTMYNQSYRTNFQCKITRNFFDNLLFIPKQFHL